MSSKYGRRLAVLAIGAIAGAFAAFPALAYVGPGAGLTLLGALWGLILAVVMSVGFVILWPFRRLMRRRKRGAARDAGTLATDSDNTMLANPTDRREER